MARVLQVGNSASDTSASSESKTEAARAEKHTRQHLQKGFFCCAAIGKNTVDQNVRKKVGRHRGQRVNSLVGRASA